MRDKVTTPVVRARKRAHGAQPLVMITAYDTPSARVADDAGVDMILVGDSVANNVLGYRDTLAVDIGVMAHHVGAVSRASTRALVVGDMPWLSYHVSVEDTIRNAATLVRAGAEAVKLEGGRERVEMIKALTSTEIPVVGHLGLTPQSVHIMGGFKVQAKEKEAIDALVADAEAVCEAGCFAVVIEGVPDVVGEQVTCAIDIPTIGIGAGPSCDGQVLVYHDLLGLNDGPLPKFVRRYADLRSEAIAAVSSWASDVRGGDFPSDAETYHLPKGA